jgi:hypothetical protein
MKFLVRQFVQSVVLLIIAVAWCFAAQLPQETKQQRLFRCIRKNPARFVIQEIIENDNALLHVCEDDGKSPLLVAACENRREIVKDLLRFGADVNHADKCGMTALMHAIQLQYANIVRVLLICDDIDLHKTSSTRETASSLALTSQPRIKKMIDEAQAKQRKNTPVNPGVAIPIVEQDSAIGAGAAVQHEDYDEELCRVCAQRVSPEQLGALEGLLQMPTRVIVWPAPTYIDF